jgi:ribosomal protein L37E
MYEEAKQGKKVRVKCRECGEEVFFMAPNCPKCGIPKPGLSASEYTKYVKRLLITIGVIVVVVVVAIIVFGKQILLFL